MRHLMTISFVAAMCFSQAAIAQTAAQCADLISTKSEAANFTAASVVAGAASIGGAKTAAGFCRIEGIARPSSDSEIKFEVWLPSDSTRWTGRLKTNGTGGYAGAIPYARLAQDIDDGFVTAGSNMGHDGGQSPAWTLNRPEKVKDWGLRAHYFVTTAAKALSAQYYGRPVKHAYFEGCSNGGRQSMMMAQNYPQLFDGIVAGAPSMFYPDLLYWLLWTGKQQIPVAGQPPVLSDAKRQMVTQKALEACDAADGLKDGQITNPRRCNFNPDTLGPSGDQSLTAQEVETLKRMYRGTVADDGKLRYPGAKVGSEADWIPLFADNGGYGRFINHFVYSRQEPNFDWRSKLDFSKTYDDSIKALSAFTAAPSPDISEFVARGGKLLHFHGWNDSVVPPDGSISYLYALTQFERFKGMPKPEFDRAIEALTPQDVLRTGEAQLSKVQQYHRLFMVPNMGHCTQVGAGPSEIGGGAAEPPKAQRTTDTHVVNAVMRWVEQGIAPTQIIATRTDKDGAVVRQRPLCAYPAQAVYSGQGDVNQASSFRCETPKINDRPLSETDMILIKSSLRQREFKLPNR
jgi:feruloyl esterase